MIESLQDLPKEKIEVLKETLAALDAAQNNEDPDWLDDGKIDEIAFSEFMLARHPMKCIHGIFYDVDGRVKEDHLKKEILDYVRPYVSSNVAKSIMRLLEALRLCAYSEELPIQTDRIHFRNGTYRIKDRSFIPEKEFCLNRLSVDYVPEADVPERWLSFLDELLYPEDIRTLQEFMGYVLLPTNKAQKMMLVIGNGGEGKSRIGRVMRALLGDNMNIGSIQKLATDRFSRADQEGKLLLLDDDMEMKALPDTNILKAIVTMEDKFDLERKGKQSVQGDLYVRLMGFGNGQMSALYDRSDGFYRRQIAMQVKDKNADRQDDRDLGEKLIAEKEGIVLWCLEGLHRLIDQGFDFSISDRTAGNMEEARKADNNIIDFLEADGYVRKEAGTTATSKQLYIAYKRWCEENLEKPLAERTFAGYLRQNAERIGIRYDKNLPGEGGKSARGYHGIHVQIRTDGFGTFRM